MGGFAIRRDTGVREEGCAVVWKLKVGWERVYQLASSLVVAREAAKFETLEESF